MSSQPSAPSGTGSSEGFGNDFIVMSVGLSGLQERGGHGRNGGAEPQGGGETARCGSRGGRGLLRRVHGFGARLQQQHVFALGEVGVDGPLDILRGAVVFFGPLGQLGYRSELSVGQAAHFLAGRFDVRSTRSLAAASGTSSTCLSPMCSKMTSSVTLSSWILSGVTVPETTVSPIP